MLKQIQIIDENGCVLISIPADIGDLTEDETMFAKGFLEQEIKERISAIKEHMRFVRRK